LRKQVLFSMKSAGWKGAGSGCELLHPAIEKQIVL